MPITETRFPDNREDEKWDVKRTGNSVVLTVVDLCALSSDGLSLSPSLPPASGVSAHPHSAGIGSVLLHEQTLFRLSRREVSHPPFVESDVRLEEWWYCSETSGETAV